MMGEPTWFQHAIASYPGATLGTDPRLLTAGTVLLMQKWERKELTCWKRRDSRCSSQSRTSSTRSGRTVPSPSATKSTSMKSGQESRQPKRWGGCARRSQRTRESRPSSTTFPRSAGSSTSVPAKSPTTLSSRECSSSRTRAALSICQATIPHSPAKCWRSTWRSSDSVSLPMNRSSRTVLLWRRILSTFTSSMPSRTKTRFPGKESDSTELCAQKRKSTVLGDAIW